MHKEDSWRDAKQKSDCDSQEEKIPYSNSTNKDDMSMQRNSSEKLPFLPCGGYKKPDHDLLNEPNEDDFSVDKQFLFSTSEQIEHFLHSRGINASVVSTSPGPIVTRFNVITEDEIRSPSRLGHFAHDFALRHNLPSVRAVWNMYEGNSIVLEVPNPKPHCICLREIIDRCEFSSDPSELLLGEDVSGEPVVLNLKTDPNLLIGGYEGSGLTVALNSMILSMLYKFAPDDLKL